MCPLTALIAVDIACTSVSAAFAVTTSFAGAAIVLLLMWIVFAVRILAL